MGDLSTEITTSSVEAGHTPLEMVQRKVAEAPLTNPVNPDIGDAGVVMVTVPATTDQEPVPVAGAFPAKVAVVTLHRV